MIWLAPKEQVPKILGINLSGKEYYNWTHLWREHMPPKGNALVGVSL